MPKRFEDPIKVSIAVLDGLESVGELGETNMDDYRAVQAVAERLGYPETALWIENHPHDYAEGVFRGFVGDRNKK
jgi:hypothetical protein